MLTLFLLACGEISNRETQNSLSTNGEINMEINFAELKWAGINWDEIEFPVDLNEFENSIEHEPILTKEEALKVGQSIIESCWKSNKFLDYSLLTVVHSTEDNIWRFDYSIDQRDKTNSTFLLCGGFYVAIDGSNGEVIKAWVEE